MTLQLHRPVRSSRITQRFGENKACILNGRIIAKDRQGRCPAGSEEYYKSVGLKGHNGHDIATIHGEAVVHCGVFAGWMKTEKDGAGGIGVDVISKKPVTLKDGTQTHIKVRYWHLKTPIGWDGREVKYGQMIGLADNTGASSGDHLHWGIKPCDMNGNTKERYNGYYGAIDPQPYYTHSLYAGDMVRQISYLGSEVPELSDQEKKEIRSQLSILKRLLLEMREFLYRL